MGKTSEPFPEQILRRNAEYCLAAPSGHWRRQQICAGKVGWAEEAISQDTMFELLRKGEFCRMEGRTRMRGN